MRKRWWLLLAAMFACVVVACVCLYPKPTATKIAFDRLEVGMNKAEVEVLFGRPGSFIAHIGSAHGGFVICDWSSEDGARATIRFDSDGKSEQKTWEESTVTLMARLRRWLPFLDR
jgi:hypothetical protein